MTDPQPQQSLFPDCAATLEDIGEEFGCSRNLDESDEEYGIRIDALLDQMLDELLSAQIRVRELVV